jgi:hypothetical protein
MTDSLDDFDKQAELVRGLRGAAASVLWALVLSGRVRRQATLVAATGYSDKPVRQALTELARQGLAQRQGSRGWVVTPAFRGELRSLLTQKPSGRAAAQAPTRARQITRPHGRRTGSQPAGLVRLLQRIGIAPPALNRLAAHPELAEDPARVLAWWWYYQTQSWPTNPAGLVICRLEDGDQPPAAFLDLARCWFRVAEVDRQEMRAMTWQAWSPQQLAAYFAEQYPGLTAGAFSAFQALLKSAPEELGYGL